MQIPWTLLILTIMHELSKTIPIGLGLGVKSCLIILPGKMKGIFIKKNSLQV